MVRMRLRYDEARTQVTNLQEQLARIEDQMIPGQTESDKDRLVYMYICTCLVTKLEKEFIVV